MPTLNRWCMFLLLPFLLACSDGGNNTVISPTPTAPTPTPAPAAVDAPPAVPPPTAPSFSMSGQVTNRATSEPIPGAEVIASYPPGIPVVTTDARGRYVATGL